mmetsp:Transcript_74892/g.148828  ORF Transcript_74892/g.148828 Transcript_74892/m.148828 type:complete len:220 (-) Transcript_74892:731-1390(-)
MRQCQLERREISMVYLDAATAELFLSVLLRIADSTILERRVDSGGHILVVHLGGIPTVQPLGQEFACLDGDWGELSQRGGRAEGVAVNDITNRIDMGNVGLLIDRRDLACLGVDLDASLVETHAPRAHIATHREHDRIVLVAAHRSVLVLPMHLLHPILQLLDAGGYGALDEVDALFGHIVLDDTGHLLVEPAERDGAHHHLGLEANAVDEACALEGDV